VTKTKPEPTNKKKRKFVDCDTTIKDKLGETNKNTEKEKSRKRQRTAN
jgi:hypothetical protein